MLTTRTAESSETVRRSIIPAGLGKSANRPRHGFVGDIDETVSDFLRRHFLISVLVDFICQFGEEFFCGFCVEGLIFFFAEEFGEEGREKAAKEEVCVCYSKWSAFSVYKSSVSEQYEKQDIWVWQ